MKIVIDNVIFQLLKDTPGGVNRVWSNTLPILKELLPNDELILLTRKGSSKENFGLATYPIPAYGRPLSVDDKMLSTICRKLHADIFISTYCTRTEAAKNILVVYDLIPEKVHGKNLSYSIDFVGRQRAYRTADILICISEYTKMELCLWYNMDSRIVETAYLGTSKEFCPKSLEEITSFREKYNVPLDYLVLDGNITKEMMQLFCPAYASTRTKFSLLSYGLPLKNYVTELCTKYKIPLYQISWLENEEVPVVLCGSKGLIYLSSCEGFGLPVLEAMSCGVPVLCSKEDSLPEVGGDSVQYLPTFNFLEMKKSVNAFLNGAKNKRLAEKGLLRSKLFTWKKFAEKIVEMIDTLRYTCTNQN